ncbi:MAG: CRTAC1 family protein [Planctomycetota bacterium]
MRPTHFSVLILLAAILVACGGNDGTNGGETASLEPGPDENGFFDRAPFAGMTFRNHTGKDEKKDYIVEAKGGGALVLDYDLDGDVDIYVVDGNHYKVGPDGSVVSRTDHAEAYNRLLRNDGNWKFTDVTEESGLGDRSYGFGGTVGDYDNDGDPDIHVCNWGPNKLYRNNGDGTFTDVTDQAGVAGGPKLHDYYSTGSCLFDADDDGDLDLYEANYNHMSEFIEKTKGNGRTAPWRGIPVYAGPFGIRAAMDRFYRNNGDGTFTDETKTALRNQHARYAFTPVVSDFDRDGDLDLYVSNDVCDNTMWINDGKGVFTDMGLETSTAMNSATSKQASMGNDSVDYDQDGWPDIYITNFSHDTNTLYRNIAGEMKDGSLMFDEVTERAGLAAGDFIKVCWGAKFQDFDLDGYMDLFVAAGHVYPEINLFEKKVGTTYKQVPTLWRNGGPPRWKFEDISDRGGSGFEKPRCGRAACFADFDNDGDMDVYIAGLNDTPLLLENRLPREGNFLMVSLAGKSRDRDAIGARVTVEAGGGKIVQMQEMRLVASFIGTNDPRLHWGVGKSSKIDRLTVEWRGGEKQVFEGLEANHLYHVEEGGEPVKVW